MELTCPICETTDYLGSLDLPDGVVPSGSVLIMCHRCGWQDQSPLDNGRMPRVWSQEEFAQLSHLEAYYPSPGVRLTPQGH